MSSLTLFVVILHYFAAVYYSSYPVGNITRTQEAEEIKKLKEALAAKEKEIAALKNKK